MFDSDNDGRISVEETKAVNTVLYSCCAVTLTKRNFTLRRSFINSTVMATD